MTGCFSASFTFVTPRQRSAASCEATVKGDNQEVWCAALATPLHWPEIGLGERPQPSQRALHVLALDRGRCGAVECRPGHGGERFQLQHETCHPRGKSCQLPHFFSLLVSSCSEQPVALCLQLQNPICRDACSDSAHLFHHPLAEMRPIHSKLWPRCPFLQASWVPNASHRSTTLIIV